MCVSVYEITALGDLHPDEMNPRERLEDREVALELSLSRFGHLMPLVADQSGCLVSGHQRYRTLCDLGAEIAPVLRVPNPEDKLLRGARLMLHNLASADISDRVHHDPSADSQRFVACVEAMAARPAIDLDDPANWPCMTAVERPIADLIAMNPDIRLGSESKADATIALARHPYFIRLPILVDADGKVVAGRQRFAAAATSNYDTWPIITVDDDPLLAEAINVISMGYASQPLADVCRASVWLTASWRRKRLGRGFIFYTDRNAVTTEFDIVKRRDDWVAKHGTYVADIGAGGFGEAGLLNSVGVTSVAFEPFALPLGDIEPNRDFTRKMTGVFLDEIAKGRPFDSVFCSAVLNQVPFEEDRIRVLTIVHALCSPDTGAYVSCLGVHNGDWQLFAAGQAHRKPTVSDVRVGGFEPGTQVTSLALGRVMIQKWHTEDELRHLLGQLWGSVQIGKNTSSWFCEAREPYPIRRNLLRRAIEHEFDLPWKNGERLGLVREAVAAFSARLGVDL